MVLVKLLPPGHGLCVGRLAVPIVSASDGSVTGQSSSSSSTCPSRVHVHGVAGGGSRSSSASGGGMTASAFMPDDSTAAGLVARGRPGHVRANAHWLLVPTAKNPNDTDPDTGEPSFTIQCVDEYWEFDAPSCRPADGFEVGGKRKLEDGEAELRRDSALRRKHADRWEDMLARRAARQGSQNLRAKIIRDMQRRPVFGESKEEIQNLAGDIRAAGVGCSKHVAGTDVGDANLAIQLIRSFPQAKKFEILEKLDNQGGLQGGMEGAVAAAIQVAWPKEVPKDDVVLKDDTGLDRHRRKILKALKRKVELAEEAEVPTTANELLQLKSEKGEGLWDFTDEENFSDDEQEKIEMEDDLDEQLLGGAVPAVPVDEEDDEVERGDQLHTQGQELDNLLQKYAEDDGVQEDQPEKGTPQNQSEASGSGSTARPIDETPPAAAAGSSPVSATVLESTGSSQPSFAAFQTVASSPIAATSSAAAASSPRLIRAAEASNASKPKASSPLGASDPKVAASSPGPAKTFEAAGSSPSSTAASTTAGSSPCSPADSENAASSNAPSATDTGVADGPERGSAAAAAKASALGAKFDDDWVRDQVIRLLRRQGGTCTATEAVAALGLRSSRSPAFTALVGAFRLVADVLQVPGESRPLLVLKDCDWGANPADGPLIPEGCRWWYVASGGARVSKRDLAERHGPAGQELYHIAVEAGPDWTTAPQNKLLWQNVRWIPASRAPEFHEAS